MKHLLPLLLLSSNLSAQVYLQTNTNPPQLLEPSHLLHAEAYQTFMADLKNSPIRVPDSIVLYLDVQNTGIKGMVEKGKSAQQSQKALAKINANHFEQPGQYRVAFVIPALDLKAIEPHEFDKFPIVGLCAEYTKTNRAFLMGCFTYELTQTNQMIFAPDYSAHPNAEGLAKMEFVVGTNGKIVQVQFNDASYNPELNDHILAQLPKITYPTGGLVNRKTTAYRVKYEHNFFNFNRKTNYKKELASNIAPQQKIFLYKKSIKESKKVDLDSNELKTIALACFAEGDTALSNEVMSLNLDLDQRKKFYYYYIKGSNPPHWELLEKKGEHQGVTNFAVVERRPVFPGCEGATNEDSLYNCFQINIMRHVAKTFVYPKKAQDKKIGGRIFVNFVIEKDGSVNEIEIARGVHPTLDAEAMRVVSELPKMIPATQRGEPVRISYTLPINAKIN
jgi:TonB family protein